MTNPPPLPPKRVIDRHTETGIVIMGFTADQMREYGEACSKAAVPEGWKLVPIEATTAMCHRANGFSIIDFDAAAEAGELSFDELRKLYKAMLNAAPTPGETK